MPTTERARRADATHAPAKAKPSAASAKKKLSGLQAGTKTKPAAKHAAKALIEKPAKRGTTISLDVPTSLAAPNWHTQTGSIDGPRAFIDRVGGQAEWQALGEKLRFYGTINDEQVKEVKQDIAKILGIDLQPNQFVIEGRGDAFSKMDGIPWVDVKLRMNGWDSVGIQLNLETGASKWRTGGAVETFPIDEGARQFARQYGLPTHDRPQAGGTGFFDPPAINSAPAIGQRGWFADFQKTLDNQVRLMGEPAVGAMRDVISKLDKHFTAASGRDIHVTIGAETGRMRGAVAGAKYEIKVSKDGGPYELCRGQLYLGDAQSHIGASASKLAGDLYSAVRDHLGVG